MNITYLELVHRLHGVAQVPDLGDRRAEVTNAEDNVVAADEAAGALRDVARGTEGRDGAFLAQVPDSRLAGVGGGRQQLQHQGMPGNLAHGRGGGLAARGGARGLGLGHVAEIPHHDLAVAAARGQQRRVAGVELDCVDGALVQVCAREGLGRRARGGGRLEDGVGGPEVKAAVDHAARDEAERAVSGGRAPGDGAEGVLDSDLAQQARRRGGSARDGVVDLECGLGLQGRDVDLARDHACGRAAGHAKATGLGEKRVKGQGGIRGEDKRVSARKDNEKWESRMEMM